MLSYPEVLTGAKNALYGFNSSVGTINYSWSQIIEGGEIRGALGNKGFNSEKRVYSF